MKPQLEEEKRPLFPAGFVAALVLLGLLFGLLTVYFIKKIYLSEKHLVPFGILALLFGLIYEYKKICEKWKTVLITSLVAYGLSFCTFVDHVGRKGYNLEQRIEAWPYVFCFCFVFLAILIHEKKTTPRATEGITLLQSVAIIYWAIDAGIYTSPGWFMKCVMGIGILFTLYSLFHAFTYVKLHGRSRLRLSVWSSIIMFVFSCENIISLHRGQELVETAESAPEAALIIAQYFFLGISCVYLAQNYFMLVRFLPGKKTFFNKEYFQDLKDLKKQHIGRYSEEQVNILYSFVCVVISGSFFTLNYHYNWVPRNFAIWMIFLILPLLIHFLHKTTYKPKLKPRPKHIIFRKDREIINEETKLR